MSAVAPDRFAALRDYRGPATAHDEFRDGDGRVREHWSRLATTYGAFGLPELHRRQDEIRRLLAQDGVTYNVETLQVQCWSEHGGGWLLVGHSGRTADPQPFGWTSTSGTLGGDRPYSLGALLDFEEILVTAGERNLQREQRYDSVVKLRVPPSFFDYRSLSSAVTFDGQLQGSCVLASVPSMFSNVGYVGEDTLFWFRDNEQLEPYGLGPGGWQLNTEGECQTDGGFGGKDGAIYVTNHGVTPGIGEVLRIDP